MWNRKQAAVGLKTKKYVLVGLLFILLVSSVLLAQAISRGTRSKEWVPVKGEIASSVFGGSRKRSRIGWHIVKVNYSFDGQQYRQRVYCFGDYRESKTGTPITVFVNPAHATELTSKQGLLAIDYAMPLTATLLSLAGIIVMVCIVYSPEDDFESEVNETLI